MQDNAIYTIMFYYIQLADLLPATLYFIIFLPSFRLSSALKPKSREKVGIKFGKSREKVGIIGVKK